MNPLPTFLFLRFLTLGSTAWMNFNLAPDKPTTTRSLPRHAPRVKGTSSMSSRQSKSPDLTFHNRTKLSLLQDQRLAIADKFAVNNVIAMFQQGKHCFPASHVKNVQSVACQEGLGLPQEKTQNEA